MQILPSWQMPEGKRLSSDIRSTKTQRVVMAVGLSGPGPNSQNQKHIVCRQFSERGSCSFGDACEFSQNASISAEKPRNASSRGATPKTTPKGTPRGIHVVEPLRKIPEKSDTSHRNQARSLKSSKLTPHPHQNPVRLQKESESESDDSLSTSREDRPSSSSE